MRNLILIRHLLTAPALGAMLLSPTGSVFASDSDRYVPSAQIHGETSRDHRDEQTVQLLLSREGYSVGLILGDDRILEAGYSGFHKNMTAYDRDRDQDEGDDEEDGDRMTAGAGRWSHAGWLRAKRFHGNSFYTYLGLSGRESGRYEDDPEDPDRSLLALDAGLGNQWSWSLFTLGVDWLAVELPVYQRVVVAATDASNARPDGDEPSGHAASELGKVRLAWVRLYAGVAF